MSIKHIKKGEEAKRMEGSKVNFRLMATALVVVLAAVFSLSIAATYGHALPTTVRIIGFHYNGGNGNPALSVTKTETLLGYSPDYNFQPEIGYKLKILDAAGTPLFGVKFDPPYEIFTDSINGTNLTGGIVVLNQTDFSMTLPTFPNESRIVMLDENNRSVLDYKIDEGSADSAATTANSGSAIPFELIIAIALVLIFVVLLLVAFRLRRKGLSRQQ